MQTNANPRISRLDRVGMVISAVCLIHCLALPILAGMLPLFAAVLPDDEWVHPLLFGLALPISGAALVRGYIVHRLASAAAIGALGLAAIAAALRVETIGAETALTVAGGIAIVAAHLLNWRGHRANCPK